MWSTDAIRWQAAASSSTSGEPYGDLRSPRPALNGNIERHTTPLRPGLLEPTSAVRAFGQLWASHHSHGRPSSDLSHISLHTDASGDTLLSGAVTRAEEPQATPALYGRLYASASSATTPLWLSKRRDAAAHGHGHSESPRRFQSPPRDLSHPGRPPDPDLLPSDVVGTRIFDSSMRS